VPGPTGTALRLVVVTSDAGTIDRPLLTERVERWAGVHGHRVEVVVSPTADLGRAVESAAGTADGTVLVDDPDGTADVWGSARPVERVVVASPDRRRTPAPDATGGARHIGGRGVDSVRWALEHAAAVATWPARRCDYGAEPDRFGELRVPDGPGPYPVVVLVHGGFWRSHWELDLMDGLAVRLVQRGYATWNLEYRRGRAAAAATLDDLAAGVDHLRRLDAPLDLSRVVIAGHSAGGQLALWASARARHGEPGALTPALCLALAPISDLAGCHGRGLGEDAAAEFFGGGPGEVPELYERADPAGRLPVGVPVLLVHGLSDGVDLIDLNRRYVGRASAAGDEVTLLELPGVDHFQIIDPVTSAWADIERALEERLARSHTTT